MVTLLFVLDECNAVPHNNFEGLLARRGDDDKTVPYVFVPSQQLYEPLIPVTPLTLLIFILIL